MAGLCFQILVESGGFRVFQSSRLRGCNLHPTRGQTRFPRASLTYDLVSHVERRKHKGPSRSSRPARERATGRRSTDTVLLPRCWGYGAVEEPVNEKADDGGRQPAARSGPGPSGGRVTGMDAASPWPSASGRWVQPARSGRHVGKEVSGASRRGPGWSEEGAGIRHKGPLSVLRRTIRKRAFERTILQRRPASTYCCCVRWPTGVVSRDASSGSSSSTKPNALSQAITRWRRDSFSMSRSMKPRQVTPASTSARCATLNGVGGTRVSSSTISFMGLPHVQGHSASARRRAA